MTRDAATGTLTARIDALLQADDRIALLVRGEEERPGAWARAALEAIEERNRIAAAVLEALAVEDRAINFRMVAAAVPIVDAPRFAEALLRRDRSIEALVLLIETQSRRFARLTRDLEAIRP